jgi:hypothetical protein
MNEKTLFDYVSLAAIFLGPVIGVLMTLHLEHRRQKHQRRWEIFKTLMRTRNIRLSQDHVAALNLVEIEFHDNPKVISAWKTYRVAMNPQPGDERNMEGVATRRNNALAKLLDAVAKVLKIKIEQIDILEGNYIPQGWHDEEEQNHLIKAQLVKVLQGQSALPIFVRQPNIAANVFPLPPKD